MKIFVVIFLKDKTPEGAFTDIEELIRTYGDLGYLMRNRMLYSIKDIELKSPIYDIQEVELRGKIKYKGIVEL